MATNKNRDGDLTGSGNDERGFASMDKERQREVAAAGGRGSQSAGRSGSGNDERGFASMDQQKQREIASKGGSASGGNFKNDPARAAAAGRKGGQASNGNRGGNGGNNSSR